MLLEECVCRGEHACRSRERVGTAQGRRKKRKVFKQQTIIEKKLDRPVVVGVCALWLRSGCSVKERAPQEPCCILR